MNYLKFTQYIYLVFGLLFIYVGFTKIGTTESPVLSFIIAGVAVFMFFFRRKFSRKFEDNNKKQ
ncbi:hypothetical protein [Flavobacterium psychrotolerans]|uniref:Uncharacterized protein n=1 Tax=Flavobacterium psychrotolerans TaxID=2169410 RepID=A0A2U1JL11_9FLAO|nr:hypothetical protein [Flavobacterium psychrotolerans]PWA05695.1 hypothetical protein DB895_06865 [Flavobacterium psychrotolerans]